MLVVVVNSSGVPSFDLLVSVIFLDKQFGFATDFFELVIVKVLE